MFICATLWNFESLNLHVLLHSHYFRESASLQIMINSLTSTTSELNYGYSCMLCLCPLTPVHVGYLTYVIIQGLIVSLNIKGFGFFIMLYTHAREKFCYLVKDVKVDPELWNLGQTTLHFLIFLIIERKLSFQAVAERCSLCTSMIWGFMVALILLFETLYGLYRLVFFRLMICFRAFFCGQVLFIYNWNIMVVALWRG